MYLKKTRLLFLAISFSALACNASESTKHSGMDHSKMDHSKMDHSTSMKMSSRKELNNADKKSVIAIFEANEELLNAFLKYDGATVENSAATLNKAIDKVSNAEISKLLKFSQTKLSDIKAASDREANNQNYHLVSMALIHVMNSYDTGGKYNAYSCPMVKKKWVQNSEKLSKVHNPYAPGMLHCGSKDSKYN